MQLSNAAKTELRWWVDNMPHVNREILHPNCSRLFKLMLPKRGGEQFLVVRKFEEGGHTVKPPNISTF